MPLLTGAEPYHHQGGETAVLLCHGFTGPPASLRPWAAHLAGQGLTVSLPLLPGHGTRWEDLRVTGWQDWYAEVDRELPQVTRPLLLLRSPQDHVVPPTDSDRILARISWTDVSTAFIGRLAPGAVKEPGLGKEGTTAGG
ncbi:hypothetical protein GCM10009535_29230 [Streptomyces thermocarboxydovorans]|uniref:Esterase n=1 Tax=Streptomyces thermocarboxydovorans TaxID=59298 RepID=A0ABP3SLK6_9ACTN